MSQYLRKDGTNRTFAWTPGMAKRKDMVACTKEDKIECDRLFDAEQKATVDARLTVLRGGQKAVDVDPFLNLDDDGCQSKAINLKIKFPKKATLQEKRDMLREAAGKMEQVKTIGTSTSIPVEAPDAVKAALASPGGDAVPAVK